MFRLICFVASSFSAVFRAFFLFFILQPAYLSCAWHFLPIFHIIYCALGIDFMHSSCVFIISTIYLTSLLIANPAFFQAMPRHFHFMGSCLLCFPHVAHTCVFPVRGRGGAERAQADRERRGRRKETAYSSTACTGVSTVKVLAKKKGSRALSEDPKNDETSVTPVFVRGIPVDGHCDPHSQDRGHEKKNIKTNHHFRACRVDKSATVVRATLIAAPKVKGTS